MLVYWVCTALGVSGAGSPVKASCLAAGVFDLAVDLWCKKLTIQYFFFSFFITLESRVEWYRFLRSSRSKGIRPGRGPAMAESDDSVFSLILLLRSSQVLEGPWTLSWVIQKSCLASGVFDLAVDLRCQIDDSIVMLITCDSSIDYVW